MNTSMSHAPKGLACPCAGNPGAGDNSTPAPTLQPEKRSPTPGFDRPFDEVIVVIADQDLPSFSAQGSRPCEILRHVQRRPLAQLPAQQAITEPDLPESPPCWRTVYS